MMNMDTSGKSRTCQIEYRNVWPFEKIYT